jgi:hypothetical protein
MPFEITADFIRRAIAGKHYNYYETVNLAFKIRLHADGIIPEELINVRRPSEPEEIKKYRSKIYVPKTRNPISKVINSLEKIRRSSDWNIQYDSKKVKSSIAEDERLEDYCEKNYPGYSSVTNWAFSELMKQYLLDANGIVAVVLDEIPVPNEYPKPTAKFFGSNQVIDYVEGKYAVLLSSDTSQYFTPGGKIQRTEGAIYYIITDTQIIKYEQINSQKDLNATVIYNHNFGKVPAFKVGGIFLKRKNNDTIFESRIASMVPSLDEAAREYSDLQAEIVQHIHSEKYAYTNSECPDCRGTGKTDNSEGKKIECKRCTGSGSILNTSPYGIHLINATSIGEHQLPNPPMGYVQKTADIAKLQDDRIRQHIYDALATLNMEFLAETPLSQSGTAKMVDKDELNNFVNSIAEDIVRILDNVYFYINEYRYQVVVPNKADREEMLPSINVPTRYDLITSSQLLMELDTASRFNMSPVIKRSLEIDFAKKRFNTEPEISYEAEAIFELDPLYGLSEDDKMTRKSNGGITELDYIISCNIVSFIKKASKGDDKFFQKSYDEKMKVMIQYAGEVQKANKLPEPQPIDLGGLKPPIPPIPAVPPTPPVAK